MRRDIHADTRKKLYEHADFAGKRIIEIGCGTGRVSQMYLPDAHKVVGIEPEFESVRTAHEMLPKAFFLCASGIELPIGCHEFDIVLFTLSLHHHPNVPVALKEAKRVLKPNGYVLVIEPTPESEIQRLCKPFEDEDDKLLAVEQALPRCCLEIISKETFQTQWVFDDYEDVVNYPFAYYQHPHDEDKRSALLAFLGSKVQTKPIHMTDTLRLTCLRPSHRAV